MSFEGSLLVVGLREVLEHLNEERDTGILTLQNDREILAVTLQRGEIVGADSLAEGEETLGAQLARERLVSAQEFSAVVAAQRTGGGRIADLLLERGAIDRPSLLGALRRHTQRLVLDVLQWTDGSYKFYPGEEVSFEEGFDPITVAEILAAAPAGAGGRGERQWLRGEGSGPEPAAPRAHTPPRAAGSSAPGGPPVAPRIAWNEPTAAPSGGALRGLETLSGLAAAPARAADERERRSVFVPPDPGPQPARSRAPGPEDRPVHRAARARRWRGLVGIAPTLVGFVAFGCWFGLRPVDLFASLPWSVSGRDEFTASRRLASFEQIDAAARAFFTVEGTYPEDLGALLGRGLLGNGSGRDPWGRPLRFTSDGLIYAVVTAGPDTGPGAMGAVESVSGDLFLDPALFGSDPEPPVTPLLLID